MAWVSSTFSENLIKTNESSINRRLPRSKSNADTRFKDDKASKRLCTNLWVDEFPPSTSEELAVHKKKLQEVQNWLVESLNKGKERRVLLLTGPPGTSKSTAIHTLGKELNFDIREWTNSSTSKQDSFKEGDFQPYMKGYSLNQSESFADFIFRSSKYKNLCVNGESKSSLILIEELPNVFVMNPIEFHQIMRKYSTCCTSPVVFVMSDSNNNNLGKSLFPAHIQDELLITNITFNPVSSSLLQNALSRILKLTSNENSPFFESVSLSKKQVLQMVAERSEGDVRSATNSLQFMLMKGAVVEEHSGDVSPKRKRRNVKKKSLVLSEDFVGCKDSNLILFRALGKILYCKREKPQGTSCDAKALPSHLSHHARDPPIEDPDNVFERCGTTASTFNLFLHQNCLPFFSSIEEFNPAIESLGDADIFETIWDPSNNMEAYSSTVSTRGMMHSLTGRQKGTQTFRSLVKPSFFDFLRKSKERLEMSKRMNKNMIVTTEELMTVFIPLVSKASLSDTEADRLMREVGLLYPASSPTKSQTTEYQTVEAKSYAPEEEEEFFIEEFDD